MIRSDIVHRDIHAYSSHPSLTALLDGSWLVAFSSGPLHAERVFHPPDHPQFWNKITRSTDQGASWSEPVIVPGYEWQGVETPGIAQISTGEVLLNQFRFKWYPLDTARQLVGAEDRIYFWNRSVGDWRAAERVADFDDHPMPFARAEDGAYVHVSEDQGRSWARTHRIETVPYLGAFSPHGVVELPDGDLLLALGSHGHCPRSANFVVRSSDRAKTWSAPVEAAAMPGCVFSEPSVAAAANGDLVLMSREERTGYIYQSRSFDFGATWTPANPLPMWGLPAQVKTLGDGSMVVVYGHRRRPGGVRASFSRDHGATWGGEVVIRDDLALTANGHNLGYPELIEYKPGRLFVVYYGEGPDGVTCIQASYVDIGPGR